MECNGNFVYKSLEKRDGGEFLNANGQNIKYDASYILKVDDFDEDTGECQERKFKISMKSTELIKKLKELQAYTKVNIIFSVVLYNTQVRLVPVDVEIVSND